MMTTSYEEIIKRFKAVSRTRTQADLAKLLGIRQSSISDAKKRISIPAEWYMKFFEKMGVNPDWLKKGSGPIYLRTEAGYGPSDGDGIPFASTLLSAPLALPIFATVYAMRGNDPKDILTEVSLQPVSKIVLPEFYIREKTIILEVDNEASSSTIRRGAYVGIDTGSKHPSSGELFAIAFQYEGIILRRLFLEQNGESFLLRAENDIYPDIRINANSKCYILGKVSWVIQNL